MDTLRKLLDDVARAERAYDEAKRLDESSPEPLECEEMTRSDHARAAYDCAVALLGRRHEEIAALRHVVSSPKNALRFTLRSHVPPGGMLLYRGSARWMRDMGPDEEAVAVAPSLPDGAPAELVAVELNYEILADYRHVIIVRPR